MKMNSHKDIQGGNVKTRFELNKEKLWPFKFEMKHIVNNAKKAANKCGKLKS